MTTKKDEEKIKDPTVKRTGVFATKEEVKHINECFSTPIMLFGGKYLTNPYEWINKYALKHGLPQTKGYYGLDPANREFLTGEEELNE